MDTFNFQTGGFVSNDIIDIMDINCLSPHINVNSQMEVLTEIVKVISENLKDKFVAPTPSDICTTIKHSDDKQIDPQPWMDLLE